MRGLVLLPDSGMHSLLTRNAGHVPVFLRCLLSLQRGGCSSLVVAGHAEPETVHTLRRLCTDPRLRSEVLWLTDAAEPSATQEKVTEETPEGEAWAVVSGSCVFDPQILREQGSVGPREMIRIGNGGATVFVCGGQAIGEGLDCDVVSRWPGLVERAESEGTLRDEPTSRYVCEIREESDLPEAGRQIFASLRDNEGGLEGALDHFLTRRLSIHLTRLLALTPLTPNQVSFINFLFGVAALYCFTLPGYAIKVIAALLLQVSSVFDHCDGEIARLKFRQSRFGGIMEMVFDQVIHTFLMFCVGVGVARDLGNQVYVTLGIICAAGSFIGCAFTLINQVFESRILGMVENPEDAVVESKTRFSRIVETFGTREFSYYLIGIAALNLLDWLLWVFACGVPLFCAMLFFFYLKEHVFGKRLVPGPAPE